MRPHITRREQWLRGAAAAILVVCTAATASVASAVADFSFIHASDVHAPMSKSNEVIGLVKGLGPIELEPYGVTAPRPAFAVVTGDLMEFGGGSGWWQEYISYWKDAGLPVYHTLGNHDNTWHATLRDLRGIGQGPSYSFDANGCHFVALMTPTIQDPRPSIGEEQLAWLRSDLKRVPSETPIFVALHHPLEGTEFASRYDRDRLLDILRERNTVLIMAGHSHGHTYRPVDGVDQFTGGSTYGPTAGFMVVSVSDGMIRAAYKKADEPTARIKILEKAIPAAVPYPQVRISSPILRQKTGTRMTVFAHLSGRPNVDKATYTIDEKLNGDLILVGEPNDWNAGSSVDVSSLLPGAHYLRVDFQEGDRHYTRATQFFVESPARPTAWRAYLGASSKVTPTIADGVVYVGANDGRLWALDAKTGKTLWSDATGAEILTQPLAAGGRVYIGNGAGQFVAYSTKGKRLWSYAAGDAVYSSPVLVGDNVIFGCNDGKLYGLNAVTGAFAWTCDDASYAVESAPCVWNGRIYYGAWDQYVRCVDASTGKLLWKELGEGSKAAEGAKRYFSPGDAAPVVVGGNLMVPDRAYYLTILNAETGERLKALKGVAAVGISEDGSHAYLRKTAGALEKIDSEGNPVWTTDCELGAIPTAPTEKGGVVYVASGRGLVSAVSSVSGKVLWQYQASPQLFVMSSVGADSANAYATSFDGHITAIRCRQP